MTNKQNELREAIIHGKTALNEMRITKLEWGRFGWIITLGSYWRVKKLKRELKYGEDLLEFMETMQALDKHLADIIAKQDQEQFDD